MTDPDRTFNERMVNLLTGVKSYTVSMTSAQLDELRRQAIGTGKFNRSGFIVFPKDQFREDDDVKQILSQIGKLQAQRRKEKK